MGENGQKVEERDGGTGGDAQTARDLLTPRAVRAAWAAPAPAAPAHRTRSWADPIVGIRIGLGVEIGRASCRERV